MAIIFKEETKQFYLHTDHTSYIIELLEGRIPLHAYWGKRLEDMPPLTTWSSSVTTCFNGMDIETSAGAEFGCTGTLPLEYPVYGAGDRRVPAFIVKFDDGSRVAQLYYVGYTITAGKPRSSKITVLVPPDRASTESLKSR